MFSTINELCCIVESEHFIICRYYSKTMNRHVRIQCHQYFFGEKDCPLVNVFTKFFHNKFFTVFKGSSSMKL